MAALTLGSQKKLKPTEKITRIGEFYAVFYDNRPIRRSTQSPRYPPQTERTKRGGWAMPKMHSLNLRILDGSNGPSLCDF